MIYYILLMLLMRKLRTKSTLNYRDFCGAVRRVGLGRVGGDPPEISFLAIGAKMGSSVGVKTHHFEKRTEVAAL